MTSTEASDGRRAVPLSERRLTVIVRNLLRATKFDSIRWRETPNGYSAIVAGAGTRDPVTAEFVETPTGVVVLEITSLGQPPVPIGATLSDAADARAIAAWSFDSVGDLRSAVAELYRLARTDIDRAFQDDDRVVAFEESLAKCLRNPPPD